MTKLRYAVFVLGMVAVFVLAGCAGDTQDLSALTPEAGAGEEAAQVTEETPAAEGEEVATPGGEVMGPEAAPAEGEEALTEGEREAEVAPQAQPTAAGEAVAEPTVAATEPAAATQPAAGSEQSRVVTIGSDGALQPESIEIDPGTRLGLTVLNLSSSDATLLFNVGAGMSGVVVPAATQTEGDPALTLTPQEVFLQFDEAGTYDVSCREGSCTGTLTVTVGGGAAEETPDAVSTEEILPDVAVTPEAGAPEATPAQ